MLNCVSTALNIKVYLSAIAIFVNFRKGSKLCLGLGNIFWDRSILQDAEWSVFNYGTTCRR